MSYCILKKVILTKKNKNNFPKIYRNKYCYFRFVFHENWGLKLQDSVVFPLDSLMLDLKQEIVYDLYACVCHTGSMYFYKSCY